MVVVAIFRALQVVAALAILGMSIAVYHWYNTETLTTAPSEVSFLLFVPIFTFFSVAYLEATPRFAPRASHPYGALVVEILNVIFYFSGGVALNVFIRQLLFCRGPICAAANVAAVGSVLAFALWMGTMGILIKQMFKLGFRRPAAARPQMKETV